MSAKSNVAYLGKNRFLLARNWNVYAPGKRRKLTFFKWWVASKQVTKWEKRLCNFVGDVVSFLKQCWPLTKSILVKRRRIFSTRTRHEIVPGHGVDTDGTAESWNRHDFGRWTRIVRRKRYTVMYILFAYVIGFISETSVDNSRSPLWVEFFAFRWRRQNRWIFLRTTVYISMCLRENLCLDPAGESVMGHLEHFGRRMVSNTGFLSEHLLH